MNESKTVLTIFENFFQANIWVSGAKWLAVAGISFNCNLYSRNFYLVDRIEYISQELFNLN